MIAALISLPLFAACRWMVGLKRRGRHPLLSYL
jgi:hypothetical protein